jgi:hypothetical protein
MNTKRSTAGGAAFGLLFTLLSACSGSREDGIEAIVTAVSQSSTDHHGDGKAHGDLASFRRSDGLRIDLQLGLLNLVPVELEPCGLEVARLVSRLGEYLNPIGAADAHSEGGEVVDGPINVVELDEAGFDLGSLTPAPGDYCGVVVELQPGAAAKHGGELDTGMGGAWVNVAPCYYPGTVGVSDEEAETATAHSCIQAKFIGAARRVTLPFAHPASLDAANRLLAVAIVVRYEEWFEDIDMALLATDAVQQAKLADNVAGALHALTSGD